MDAWSFNEEGSRDVERGRKKKRRQGSAILHYSKYEYASEARHFLFPEFLKGPSYFDSSTTTSLASRLLADY